VQVSAGQCRSVQVGAGRCRSVQVGAGQCRSVQVSAGRCRLMQVNAGRVMVHVHYSNSPFPRVFIPLKSYNKAKSKGNNII
jgi:hypothetical protein